MLAYHVLLQGNVLFTTVRTELTYKLGLFTTLESLVSEHALLPAVAPTTGLAPELEVF